MSFLVGIALVVSCAVINHIRGGGVVQLPKGRCDDIAAILFGCVAWAVTDEPLALFTMAAAYRLGETPGWGQWVGYAIGGPQLPENGPVDRLLRKLERRPHLWAVTGLLIRGAFFGLCLALGMAYFSTQLAVALFVAGLFMPAAYYVTRLSSADLTARWGMGEYIYGAGFGFAFLAYLITNNWSALWTN